MTSDSGASETRNAPSPAGLYVFHHIPRCGGQALALAFRRWFEVVEDYAQFDPRTSTSSYGPPVDLSTLGPAGLLCGHWAEPGRTLPERYPQLLALPGVRLITFLREPQDLVESLHAYEQMRWADHVPRTLEDRMAFSGNYMASVLGCDARNFLAVIDRFWFIGITGRMQESFDLLADRLGKPRFRMDRVNAAPRSGPAPSPAALARFKADSALDYEIYRIGLARLESDLARRPDPSPREALQ